MSTVYDEARYLKAFCHSRQGDLEDGLRALLPLRGKKLDGELDRRVDVLRQDLRGVLAPQAVISFLLSFPIQPDQAEAQLRDVIALDPEMTDYYFVLAGALAYGGELEKALEVAEDGLENATDDGQRLGAMAEQIRRQLVAPKLAGAVEAFKDGDYREARGRLKDVPPEWRRIQVVEDFEEYLAQLVRRRKTAHSLTPHGPFERVDALYFLLARAEIGAAKELLGRQDPRAAERVLERALTFVPRFPYANFLYAVSIYHSVGEWITEPEDADFDRQLARLKRAATAAEIAATDDEIEQARDLAEAIEGVSTFIAQLGRHLEAQVQEAAAVNAAIEEFQAIMESARTGVSGSEHFAEVRRRLVALRDSMPELRRTAVSEDGKKVVGQLEAAVGRNLGELEKASAYQECSNEFREIMESVGDGIESTEQLQRLYARLERLHDKIERAKKEAGDRSARRALDQLGKAVGKHLKELEKPVAGSGAGDLIQEFNAIIESVGDGIENEAQLKDVHSRLRALRDKIEPAKRGVKDKDAKRALDRLAKAVQVHLDQLAEPLAGPRIKAIVDMFNMAMEDLNKSAPLSSSDARKKREMMEAIRWAARDERSKVGDKNAREVLDEIDRVATQVIQVLGV